MSKLWLIIKREYLTRVKKRTFILATLGTPLAIALFLAVEIYLLSYESESERIAVVDDSGIYKNTIKGIKNSKSVKLFLKNEPLEDLRKSYKENKYDGVLHIPDAANKIENKNLQITYYSEDKLGIVSKEFIERTIRDRIRDFKIDESGYDRNILDNFKASVELTQKTGEKAGEEQHFSADIASVFGILVGYVMFFVVLIYGSMVMRSVMEEKTNRIVEVVISSVKPFQLMLGKIVGVGMVGLTQLAIWAILIPGIIILTSMFISGNVEPSALDDMNSMAGGSAMDPEDTIAYIEQVIAELSQQNWWVIIPLFLFYFLGGYFLYSSIFAALGSAIGDDVAEGQSLTIPITLLIALAFFFMFASIRNPNSSLAFWSALFPFFSPIVMPAQLAFNPPWWEILLSMVILVATAIFFVWLSGRIYRVGILMYGKKASFNELRKWMFYKD